MFESQRPYLTKGANVTVEGSLIQERWVTKDGEKRNKIVIQSYTLYLGPRKKDGGNGTPKFEKESYDNSEPENQMPPSDEFIEDFPF